MQSGTGEPKIRLRRGGWNERDWDRVSRSGGESKGVVEWGIQDRVQTGTRVRVGRTVAERKTASGKENRHNRITGSK